MSYIFDSRLGKQLYRLLPEVYRTRDRYDEKTGQARNEDLAKYLDAHGQLLDLIHGTLQQQLRDTLPTTSQDWLLPYFGQLLAVDIVSPDAAGKHAEVAQAISWRKRKGTLKVAEEIAEAVGQMEAEIQEGWKRVAMTPRIDMPLMPVSVVDSSLEIDKKIPSQAARHPSLPAAMVDLRRPSRAVEAPATNPAAKQSSFGGQNLYWRQLNRHGVPCFPGSFDDLSRRTVDIRSESAHHGHYHHKRLLAYVSPPDGLMPFDAIKLTWSERNESLYEHLIKQTVENGVTVIRNNTRRVVVVTDDVSLDAGLYKIEGINFIGELKVASGGTLALVNVEAGRVDVATPSTDDPVVTANDCLIGVLSVGGLVRLDSCTVREQAYLTSIQARDCLLMGIVGTDISGVVEYTRYPSMAPFSENDMTIEDCTSDEPVFFHHQIALNARSVLAPDTPAGIYQGASDGGELGYFHHGREGRPVRLDGDFSTVDALHLPTQGGYALQDVIFEGDVEVRSGRFVVQRCAIAKLTVNAGLSIDVHGRDLPALDACDCLFDEIIVANGLSRLEYCTVMRAAHCKRLQASDSIFVGSITDGAGGEPESGCLRYSRIPVEFDGRSLNVFSGHGSTNTTEMPVFIRFDNCSGSAYEQRVAKSGEAGYGVLDRFTPDAIRFGAEDGAEMGAHHHKYYSLKIEAVLDKLRQFLPVGIGPVLILDRRLLRLPPEIKNSSHGESS
ncbi:hypothetical protein FCL47_12225 [Desulfopila sp. IMCC35006]|uniref:hypothetical protein n=1 Tax=Desulfopila sp. IMCC35006 TaxID=2569542 RepID=UPI0010ABD95C|nr:hypothetical protein [Desulfopila sp. IMCC35006]TKB25856.1 hypothetical protein FCL47_12225 [Desulfopila sp. IMCC35006]